ncbi:hypothetical protein ACOMHN_032926 [Nucella lapillus]
MYPSNWCLCSLLVVLCWVDLAHSTYYRQLHSPRWASRGSGGTRSSAVVHRATDLPPQGGSVPQGSDAVSRGQYYSRLFGRLRSNRGFPNRREFTPSSSLFSASFSSSSSDIPMPPEIAAMIPPGGTIHDIPKSQLAALTGDPDYTQFRLLFLRQLCQRLLNGPRSDLFQVCLSINRS